MNFNIKLVLFVAFVVGLSFLVAMEVINFAAIYVYSHGSMGYGL